MEHLWSLLCQNMLVNEVTQTISLIEVLERINFEVGEQPSDINLRVLPISMNLVSMWSRSESDKPETGRARVLIKGLDGKTIKGPTPTEYSIDAETNRGFRANVRFNGFPFMGSGIYRVIVQLEVNNKWRNVAGLPLEIIKGLPQNLTETNP